MAAGLNPAQCGAEPGSPPAISAPAPWLLLAETRVFAERPWFALRTLSLRGLPRGDGHAVLVLPGFGASDRTTRPLRRTLTRLGYAVYGWGQGRNLGMRPHIRLTLSAQLHDLNARHGGPVSLIGWSLGGVFARELARHHPDLVRDVHTLGSPFNGRPDANNVHRLFALANRGRRSAIDWEDFEKRRQPPPVPCTAIHSRSDGIVAWRCCLEEDAATTRNVEVRGSHVGLVVNLQVLRELAAGLAKPCRQ